MDTYNTCLLSIFSVMQSNICLDNRQNKHAHNSKSLATHFETLNGPVPFAWGKEILSIRIPNRVCLEIPKRFAERENRKE